MHLLYGVILLLLLFFLLMDSSLMAHSAECFLLLDKKVKGIAVFPSIVTNFQSRIINLEERASSPECAFTAIFTFSKLSCIEIGKNICLCVIKQFINLIITHKFFYFSQEDSEK